MRIHRLAICSAAVCLLAAVPATTALAKKAKTIKPKAGVYGLGTPSDFQLQVKGSKIITLQTPCASNGSTTTIPGAKIKISKAGKFSYSGPITFSGGTANGTIKGAFTSKTKVKASLTYDTPVGCQNYATMNAKFAGAGG